MRVHHQPAYVLLNRPYSESSWIVEILSKDYGRLSLMAKGARRVKSQIKGVLQPFQPLFVSWVGKGEMPTLTGAEIRTSEINLIEHELHGDQLVCGFYCNELIVYLLHRYDPHPELFDRYHQTILGLYDPSSVANEVSLARTLREFEQMVIRETGYEVSFKLEADAKTPIDPEKFYRFQSAQGFVACPEYTKNSVKGDLVLALQSSKLENMSETNRSRSKHLMRDILSQSLGYRKINSRELFFPKSR